jgi:hypothetical protein
MALDTPHTSHLFDFTVENGQHLHASLIELRGQGVSLLLPNVEYDALLCSLSELQACVESEVLWGLRVRLAGNLEPFTGTLTADCLHHISLTVAHLWCVHPPCTLGLSIDCAGKNIRATVRLPFGSQRAPSYLASPDV